MMSRQTINELPDDVVDMVIEGFCEACKGVYYVRDSDCRYFCDGFQHEAQEILNDSA